MVFRHVPFRTIELYLPAREQTPHWGAEPEAPVGGVYILKRGNPGRCANCVSWQASKEFVGGQIILNHILVIGILQRNQLDNEGTTEDQIVNTLKNSFRARVVDGGRGVLAEGRLGDEPSPNEGTPIPTGNPKIPKLTLLSALHHKASDNGPIHYGNWQDHGELSHLWTEYWEIIQQYVRMYPFTFLFSWLMTLQGQERNSEIT